MNEKVRRPIYNARDYGVDRDAPLRATNINSVETVSVIRIESILGAGVHGDPVRRIVEFYSLDGEFLARNDPMADAYAPPHDT